MKKWDSETWSNLRVERRGAIAVVRIHRPEKRNTLSAGTMRELLLIAQLLKPDTTVQSVILAGGPENFSAGADLSDPEVVDAPKLTLLETRQAALLGPDMCKAWESLEQVTIVAIEGYCVGGASALALSCDFRIGGDGAKMRLPEIALGINMSWHAIPRLVALAGPAVAKRYTIFAEFATTEQMLRWGMIDEIAPKGGAFDVALEWAQKAAALPPLPVRMTKETVNAVAHVLNAAVSHMDRDQYLLTARSGDFREGVSAFFEKRMPDFKGD